VKSIIGLIVLLYVGCILFCCADLVGGSMYLVRTGWILLDEAKWTNSQPGSGVKTVESWLGYRDSHLKKFESWGDKQLVPKWSPPSRQKTQIASLIDLEHCVLVNTIVLDPPNSYKRANAVVPLAVHGCGVTSLLVHRTGATAHKVGMVNMPPYTLVQGNESATLRVGLESEDDATRAKKEN
jgi:hypothetical protein